MKNLKLLILLIPIVLISGIACEKAESISGDSSLKIINDCSTSVRIYFDGDYIGRVGSDESETWSVPSGTHEIKATSSFHNDFKKTYNFIAGQTRIIRLEISFNRESILQAFNSDGL